MKLPRPELIVLDLDGTLIDSAPDLAFALEEMLRRLGLSPIRKEVIGQWIGNGVSHLVKRALSGGSAPAGEPERFEEAMAVFSEIYAARLFDRGEIYPGVREGLEKLKEEGYLLACVTNKHSRFTRPLMERSGLGRYLDYVGCGDDFERQKPDPLPLLKTAERFGVEPAKAVMVGDSVNDVRAGRAAGFTVVCVPYGYRGDRSVADLKADEVADTLADLPALFESRQVE